VQIKKEGATVYTARTIWLTCAKMVSRFICTRASNWDKSGPAAMKKIMAAMLL